MNSIKLEDERIILEYELTHNYVDDFSLNDKLIFSGFKKKLETNSKITYEYSKTYEHIKYLKKIKDLINFFKENPKFGPLNVSESINNEIFSLEKESNLYKMALQNGEIVKSKKTHDIILGKNFQRSLLDFQIESVEHLLAVNNGANFSVPGSGKTTITYAAISKWIEDELIEKIMVIGPLASFLPWEEEFENCFGITPRQIRISGDNVKYLEYGADNYNLFLMHYQTANLKRYEIKNLLQKYKFVLIVDESHRIKNPDLGAYADAALFLAPHANRRIILSGTPMPNDARDLWTQMTFLWPNDSPLGNQLPYNDYVKTRGLNSEHRKTLNSLFCRIKKQDLNLPKPNMILYDVELDTVQQEIYNAIAAQTLEEIDNLHDQARLQRFRAAKIIRLLQTASNPTLLHEMSDEFKVHSPLFSSPREQVSSQFGMEVDEDLVDTTDLQSLSIWDKISKYSEIEIPKKIRRVVEITTKLVNEQNEKVIIWSTFLKNMEILQNQLLEQFSPIVINGSISKDPFTSPNRDELINRFKNDPDSKVLIATPASLGESVSLHVNSKGESVCKNAIYLDRNFNGAQYMQSVDRIHRIGISKDIAVNYHIIRGLNTIDELVHDRLIQKESEMTRALNDDFLQNIDFNVIKESQTESEQDYRELVKHLRIKKSLYGN